jgi:hypothetical protein
MIDNNILAISNVMFRDKKDWSKVSDEQKDQFFFIFNRYFSKRYPMESQFLNDKNIDKSIAMDLWFEFMKTQPYPKWFWSKSTEKSEKGEFNEKELSMLRQYLDIKSEELDFLIKHHKDEVIEELEYLKKSNK